MVLAVGLAVLLAVMAGASAVARVLPIMRRAPGIFEVHGAANDPRF